MPFLEDLHAYCQAHTTPPSPVLQQLERETHLKTLAPQMMSGPLQGQLLRMLSQMLRPQQILEIGTFTGYASICLAEGLRDGGQLHTIEANPELEAIIRKYLVMAGVGEQVKLYLGDALEIIPTLSGPFDLVFIDAGKIDYGTYFELIIDRVNPGGIILADNVLWDGKVTQSNIKDKDTNHLQQFNALVQADPRVENLILPLRDGLLMARRL